MVKKLLKTSPLLLFLTLCKSPTAEAHFLWKIESDPPSYLYGTVHSSDHSVRNLPAEVTDAVTASNSFHPEIEFSPENIGRITAATLAPLDKKTEWNLAPDLKKRIEKAAAEVGIPQILLQNIPLQILPLLLSAPPETDFNQIVDLQVYQLAKKQNLEIQQLETVDEQIGVFRNLSDADAIELLKE